MKKKATALTLAAVLMLCLALAACGLIDTTTTTDNGKKPTETAENSGNKADDPKAETLDSGNDLATVPESSPVAPPKPTKPPEDVDAKYFTLTTVDGWEVSDKGDWSVDLTNPHFTASDRNDDEAFITINSSEHSGPNAQVKDFLSAYPEDIEQLDNLVCDGQEYLRVVDISTNKTYLYTSLEAFNPDAQGYIEIIVGTIADLDLFIPMLDMIKTKSSGGGSPTAPKTDSGFDPSADAGRFIGGTYSQTVGDFTITAEWIPFEESVEMVDKTEGAYLALDNDFYYLLSDRILSQYKLVNGCLMFVKEIELPGSGKYISFTQGDDGALYLTSNASSFVVVKNGEVIVLAEGRNGQNNVSMHPSGEWGLTRKGEKAIWDGEKFTTEVFLEDSRLTYLSASKNHVFTGWYTHIMGKNDSPVKGVVVYDLDGNEVMTLCEDLEYEGYGVTPMRISDPRGVVETQNGFMVCDNSSSKLVFFEPDSKPIGEINLKDLFGFASRDNLRVREPARLPDGSVLISVVYPRSNDAFKEIIVYRVSGF